MATDTDQDRLVMSQTFCERCGFPVPMRWLHAGGDLARPNHIHQCVDRPLMRQVEQMRPFTIRESAEPCS